MVEHENNIEVINPHDKLFRETYRDKENVRSFLNQYLPDQVLKLVDLSTLEISKDSFIEKDLADYYSDILYRVMLKDGSAGLIYMLFEHKSYHDKYVHLQLLEYMLKIWRLYIKQHKGRRRSVKLPVVIPLLICHAGKEWPEDGVRLTSLLSGPVDELAGYIPDFGFELYDLHRFSDDQIKGTIMGRVMLLLFKYIFKPELKHKLPEIFSLLGILMKKETGLQYLETVIRYLASVLDEEDLSLQQIKEMAEQAISKETGRYIMTLAEKLRKEGEKKGELKGFREAIELGITLKFPGDFDAIMAKVNKIDDVEMLVKIIEAIKTGKDEAEIWALVD
ncbi:Rpn family recombination-promoting nuclease/putative transposase [Desulfobacter latus]|uniref:Rpn family recombination-promoting nuclease/putative transposase n=1 Tax=Desulfobacter latus TaxID=2292 RepID=A0A850TDY1_9BACT|nr:Rpn family recombination-promoting nuclease/putative transposase [Desulfobacter latus]NWH06497.1 Rpn family recombination-promoting nuclease/putative transposase [Desulfobacter latus]